MQSKGSQTAVCRVARRFLVVANVVLAGLVVVPAGHAFCVPGYPVNTSPPVLSGTSAVGDVLTTSDGEWEVCDGVDSYEYQWLRDETPIVGATAASYTVTEADVNSDLMARVTAYAISPKYWTSADSDVFSVPVTPNPEDQAWADKPPFEAPPGGWITTEPFGDGEKITIRRADGTVYAERTTDAEGRPSHTQYFSPTGDPDVAFFAAWEDPTVQPRPRGCGDTPTPLGLNHLLQTDFPFEWVYVAGSTPAGVGGIARTVAALRAARTTWELNQNNCDVPDLSYVNFTYAGRMQTVFNPENGVNSVGFGDVGTIPDCVGPGFIPAAGCTGVDPVDDPFAPGHRIVEADIRLHRPYAWAHGAVSQRFDVQAVMTHETGHVIGFEEAPSFDSTMFPNIQRGTIGHRSLSWGDARANNQKYPQ